MIVDRLSSMAGMVKSSLVDCGNDEVIARQSSLVNGGNGEVVIGEILEEETSMLEGESRRRRRGKGRGQCYSKMVSRSTIAEDEEIARR